MRPNGERPASWSVECSQHVTARFKELQRRAAQLGIGNQTLAAMRTLIARLQSDPHSCGEPLFRLPTLKLMIRVVLVPPLVVHFAVHEDMPLVFLKGIYPMSGHGLEPEQ